MGAHEILTYVVEPVAALVIVGLLGFMARTLRSHWRIADDQKVHAAVTDALNPVDEKLQKRLDDQDEMMQRQDEKLAKLSNRLVRIETDQFGANHGGLREQVNKISAEQARQSAVLNRQDAALAAFAANQRGLLEQIGKIGVELGQQGAAIAAVAGRLETLMSVLQVTRFASLTTGVVVDAPFPDDPETPKEGKG